MRLCWRGPQIMRCIRIAASKVQELTAALRAALDARDVARIASRVRRHATAPAPAVQQPIGAH